MARTYFQTNSSQTDYMYNVLRKAGKQFKIFVHTWETTDGTQNTWSARLHFKIDNSALYSMPNLGAPISVDNENIFLNSLNMSHYYHRGKKEWQYQLLKNSICAMESLKRATNLMLNHSQTPDYVIFVRPDIKMVSPFPLEQIYGPPKSLAPNEILIPSDNSGDGLNDRFAVTPFSKAHIYGRRVEGLKWYRAHVNFIIAERYLAYVISRAKLTTRHLMWPFKLRRYSKGRPPAPAVNATSVKKSSVAITNTTVVFSTSP